MKIRRNFQEAEFDSLLINIEECHNSTRKVLNKTACKSKSEIEKFMASNLFEFNY